MSAVLAPQISLPRMSNPYSVVPNGCSPEGGRYGVSCGKFGGDKFSILNGVNQGEYTPNIAINRIITNPAIVRGLRRRLNSFLLDLIFPI
ncbi:hypothetical protein ES705_50214 [subsurface metagenome]